MRHHPTTCKYCGAQIHYMSCGCGCKFFVNQLGDPWPKHACLTKPDGITCSFSYSQDPVPLPIELSGVVEVADVETMTATELESVAPFSISKSTNIVRERLDEQFCQIKVLDSGGEVFLLALPVQEALELRPQVSQRIHIRARCRMLHNFALYEVQVWERP